MTRAEILAWTKTLAGEAAARAVAMVQGGLSINTKADGTVVTQVDRGIERFLREAITARFPGHAILGEEFGHESVSAGTDAPLWALDPIDGTTNLANGLPLWGISVGLIENDTPVVGVVACPQLGETFAGALGLGATLNDVALAPLPAGGATDWEDTYAICSSAIHDLDFSRLPARLRVLGSAALDLCCVASGRVHGCQSIGVSLYDVAAGLCIAHEASAQTVWLSGAPFSPRGLVESGPRADDILATAPPQTLAFVRSRVSRRPR